LAEETNIPLATLKKILKQSKRIVSRVEGKGRTARTLVSTVALVVEQAIRHALTKKQEQSEQYITFLATFTEAAHYITQKMTKEPLTLTEQNTILTALPEGDSPSRQILLLLDKVYQSRSRGHLQRTAGT
ncbi:plasmid replication protein, partial [Listeria monocytogenes]|nr:plasmid replication protein [Listeria monocytogenes]